MTFAAKPPAAKTKPRGESAAVMGWIMHRGEEVWPEA